MKYVLPAVLIIVIGLLILKITRDKQTSTEIPTDMTTNMHVVKVDEVLQASTYTYLKVKEKNQKYWIVASKVDAKKGETFSYDNAMEKRDFRSEDLDRVFESVLFIDNLIKGDASQRIAVPQEHKANKPKEALSDDVKVEKAEGGITIGELFASPKDYQDKRVIIKGKVVKVNLFVMGKNWIHIQDGTRNGDDFDLTITTQEEIEEGQVITFEGVITLDKDFGAGYFYAVIMEEATSNQE